MSSPVSTYLSKAGEEVIRKLFKTVRATRYEDPVDQDSFLLGSAKLVLSFRAQVISFAVVPELAECVFTIRSMMHSNNARLGTPLSDAFISLQDFAGEIVRKRQVIHDRKLAQADRARAAEGVAARLEHRAALEHAARVNNNALPSPEEDEVSIPSATGESGGDEASPVVRDPPASPIIDLTNTPVIAQAFPLSPLHDLQARLRSLSLSTPLTSPPHSLLSRSPSLPDLVPDFTLHPRKVPVKGGGWERGRTPAHHRRNVSTPVPIAQCHTVRLVPRPFGLPPNHLRTNYVDDWLESTQNSTGSRAHKRPSPGSSNRSRNPNHSRRRPAPKKVKRCFNCCVADHLVALCPMREVLN
ncbi:hypothetical protein DFH08DRAFT_961546 [Mycena albidolilacea]|uniref:Uncharacterized protein n=1 Tax=Mycena albidolilacea TaxID=1033008 RepID=A0AAD6ZYJ1_9AGAR|nr:hypothetical protein DFH08DRAFT_961546 [Mycena albidolilacea]